MWTRWANFLLSAVLIVAGAHTAISGALWFWVSPRLFPSALGLLLSGATTLTLGARLLRHPKPSLVLH